MDDYKYQYKSRVLRVKDGDTFVALIDLGFGVYIEKTVRLYPLNTPESNDKDEAIRDAAAQATVRLQELIEGKEVMLVTIKSTEKFGRYLARCLLTENGLVEDVGQTMIDEQQGEEYHGGKRL